MSKLEKLIQQLCPDGVDYKELGTVATISRGGNFQKKDYVENGFPCIHYGQIYTKYNLFVNDVVSYISPTTAKKQKKAVYGDIVMAVTSENIEDVCKCVAWIGNGEIAVSGHTAIIHHKLEPKYLVYYLNSSLFFRQKLKLVQGTKVMEVSPDKLKKVKLPVPPMEVQREIVRILDQFTELTVELTTKLTAELTARKKQYEYYRDKLFVFSGTAIEKPLETEFPSIRNGFVGTITSFFSDEEHGVRYLEGRDIHNGTISDDKAVYVTREFHNKHLKTQLQSDDIVVVQSGHVGECAVVGDKYAGANCHALIVMSNGGNCDSRYVAYYLQSSEGKRKLASITTGGTVKHILASKIKKLSVPFPPIEEQRRIVSILDRLGTLYNDLSSDLSVEAEACRKQYEYYRNKLLTFKEKTKREGI